MYLPQACWSLLAYCTPSCLISRLWSPTTPMYQVNLFLDHSVNDCMQVHYNASRPRKLTLRCVLYNSCPVTLRPQQGKQMQQLLKKCPMRGYCFADYIPRYKLWTGLVAPMWLVIRFCTWISDVTLVTSQVMKVSLRVFCPVQAQSLHGSTLMHNNRILACWQKTWFAHLMSSMACPTSLLLHSA